MDGDAKRLQQWITKLNEQIFVDGDVIVLYADVGNEGSRYEVPRNECGNAGEILRWTFHLSEKTWMDRELLRHFMNVAANAASVSLHGV
jgi:hypothetical protein